MQTFQGGSRWLRRPRGRHPAILDRAGKIHTMLALIWVIGGVGGAAAQETTADPERPWIAPADELLASGQREQALDAYQRLVAMHPEDAALRLRIASVHLLLGRPGPALEAARTAESFDPDDPEVYVVLSQCLAATRDLGGAFQTLEKALERFPQDVQVLEMLATLSIGTGRWPQASGLLRELLRIDPANAAYRIDLARVLLETQDLDAAQEETQKLLQAAPGEPLVLALAGRVSLLQGRTAEAAALFERSLAVEPNADAHGGLGAVYFLEGDAPGAVTHLQQAVGLSPADPNLRFNLANALMQTGHLVEAEKSYRESLRLDPDAADTHTNLGVLLLNMLRVREAREHLERAVALDSTVVTPYLHLARVTRAQYDYQASLANYRAYEERVTDAEEKRRIAAVILDVTAEQQASRAAQARGEIHILQMRLPTAELALAVAERVQRGEDFYSLAEQNSELTDVTGVDAGFLDPTTLGPPFQQAVSRLKVGECTGPIAVESGVYLFMRVE